MDAAIDTSAWKSNLRHTANYKWQKSLETDVWSKETKRRRVKQGDRRVEQGDKGDVWSKETDVWSKETRRRRVEQGDRRVEQGDKEETC